MRSTAIGEAERTHGVKSLYLFEGKMRPFKEIRMIVRAQGCAHTEAQLRDRCRSGFDTMEKMLRPIDERFRSSIKPERLQFVAVAIKYSSNVVVECPECGHDSPLMFWRIGNHERYRCTQCQTIFEVEMK